LRFICDQNVSTAVARALRKAGHQAWTTGEAGLHAAKDDDLTIYAQARGAVLITHDVEFSTRRRQMVTGQHVWLDCPAWHAAVVLLDHLDEILPILARRPDVWIRLAPNAEMKLSSTWE